MKISQVIATVNELKPNDYEKEKINWLSTLDMQIKTEILDGYEGNENLEFDGYDQDVSTETELLVPAPFDEMYIYYLLAKIDYHNNEFDKYDINITTFDALFDNYRRYYIRTHKPNGFSHITYF